MPKANSDSQTADLKAVLQNQHSTAVQLRRLLEQEHTLVQQRDSARLISVVEQKQDTVIALEGLEKQRRDTADRAGYPDSELMHHPSAELRDLWKQLICVIRDCREANLANHALIEASKAFNSRLLAILTGSAEEIAGPSQYDPGGRTDPGTTSRSFGSA